MSPGNAFILAIALVAVIAMPIAICDARRHPEPVAPYSPPGVDRVLHDEARGVTCWKVDGVGLSCLPDAQLRDGGAP